MDSKRWVKFTKFTLAWALAGVFLFLLPYLYLVVNNFPYGRSTFQGQGYITISAIILHLPALLMGTIITSDIPRSLEFALMSLANAIVYGGIGALYWVVRNKVRSRLNR